MKAAQVTRTVNYPILTNIHPLVTEITEIFPNDQSPPLITMFKYLDERINNHQKGLDSFEKSLKTIEFIKKNQENMKVEIKKDLLVELATKADINEIRGEMNTKLSELRGDMNTKLEGLRGEITAVATELRGEITAFATEFRGEITAVATELRGEITAVAKQLSGEINSLNNKLSGEINSLNNKLSGEINSLNNKLSGEINSKNNKLRGDLEKQIADLRGEMRTGFEMIRADISNLKIWFKMFTFSALIIVFMFSPNFITLLKYLKWF